MSDAEFFDVSVDMLAVAGLDGFFRRVNPAWSRVLGYTEEELLATPYLTLLHPDDLERTAAQVQTMAETGISTFAWEARLRLKDGSYRWVLGSARPDLSVGIMHLVVKDVDDRHSAEEVLLSRLALEELVTSLSTRFLHVANEDIPAAVATSLAELGSLFAIDRAYVVRADDAVRAISLYEEWWAEGAPRDVTLVADLPREARRFWARQLRTGELTHFPSLDDVPVDEPEVRAALAADGVVSLLFLPLTSRGRTDGFLGFEGRRVEYRWSSDDIALMRTVGEIFVSALDRARAEAALATAARELERQNNELQRSNRDLEAFASVASHDLKAPLRVVRGFLDLLERVAAERLGVDGQRYVTAAQRGTARMEALVDDLLTYASAGRSHGTLGPVALDAVLAGVLADIAALLEESGAVVTADPLPVVVGDDTQLRQLLQNLISNALKFVDPAATPRVHLTAVRQGDEWYVSVEDNGIGVPPAERERIFSMFVRLHGHDDFPGTGIGLAVCEKVVANLGGRLYVEDSPSGGSRFVFTLPASA